LWAGWGIAARWPARPRQSAWPPRRRGKTFARGGRVPLRKWKSWRLIPIARVDAVKHPKIRRPVGAAAARIMVLVLLGGLGADVGRDFDQIALGRFQLDLDVDGVEQRLHQHERFARGL